MARLAVEQRQTIGNHSYDHPDFSSISYAEQVSQLRRNSDAWWKASKAVPQPFFRPPYGSQTATTLKAAGTPGTATSSCGTATPAPGAASPRRRWPPTPSPPPNPERSSSSTRKWNSDAALPAVLKGLKAKGLKAVSLAQLCADAGLPYSTRLHRSRAAPRPPQSGPRALYAPVVRSAVSGSPSPSIDELVDRCTGVPVSQTKGLHSPRERRRQSRSRVA